MCQSLSLCILSCGVPHGLVLGPLVFNHTCLHFLILQEIRTSAFTNVQMTRSSAYLQQVQITNGLYTRVQHTRTRDHFNQNPLPLYHLEPVS